MTLPDRELTPTELRQLIESNARAIQANSNGMAELRSAIAETNRTMTEGFRETNQAVFQLASLMERFFTSQIATNTTLEQRINQIDPQN